MSKWTQNLPVTLILYEESEKNGLMAICWPPDSKMGGAYRKRLLNRSRFNERHTLNNSNFNYLAKYAIQLV